jgi:pSer/pThr/pTyr-binding forkhead associated (FHA) protein
MIICPECQVQQYDGSLFCLECGGPLFQKEDKSPGEAADIFDLGTNNSRLDEEKEIKFTPEAGLALLVLDTQETIYLTGKEVYTLGRLSGGQSILPDVDLTLHRAFEKGVSRLHATLRTESTGIVISDLGSVNGTKINGVKIMPTKAYPLRNQDILDLGKMKIKVIFL